MVGEEEKVMDGEVERESGEETEEQEKEDGDRRGEGFNAKQETHERI